MLLHERKRDTRIYLLQLEISYWQKTCLKGFYGTSDSSKLTAEQKETISNIHGLAAAGTGAAVGNSATAYGASQAAGNAVENNWSSEKTSAAAAIVTRNYAQLANVLSASYSDDEINRYIDYLQNNPDKQISIVQFLMQENSKHNDSASSNSSSNNNDISTPATPMPPDPDDDKTNNHKKTDNHDKSPYSGDLVPVPKPDAHADALAIRINGRSRVSFSNDPIKREFDAISDEYIAQAKPASLTLGKSFRDQARITFEVAQATGRKVYYHFEGGTPSPAIVAKLKEYSRRYGIEVIIDSKPLNF